MVANIENPQVGEHYIFIYIRRELVIRAVEYDKGWECWLVNYALVGSDGIPVEGIPLDKWMEEVEVGNIVKLPELVQQRIVHKNPMRGRRLIQL